MLLLHYVCKAKGLCMLRLLLVHCHIQRRLSERPIQIQIPRSGGGGQGGFGSDEGREWQDLLDPAQVMRPCMCLSLGCRALSTPHIHHRITSQVHVTQSSLHIHHTPCYHIGPACHTPALSQGRAFVSAPRPQSSSPPPPSPPPPALTRTHY